MVCVCEDVIRACQLTMFLRTLGFSGNSITAVPSVSESFISKVTYLTPLYALPCNKICLCAACGLFGALLKIFSEKLAHDKAVHYWRYQDWIF